MQAVDEKTFCFEGYALDLRRGCLRNEEREVELRPKSFDVLRYLLENAGRLVAKDELIRAVWPNVIGTDESLTRCVSEVRFALQDQSHRIIKTVPRRGYLLAAAVSHPALEPGGGGLPPVSAPAALVRAEAPATAASRETRGYAGVSVRPSLPDKPSIAVLPFQNMSAEPEQECFADGIVDDITTALSRFKSLFVIARNSSFVYKGKAIDIKHVGRDLGVRYVLEGSVRKAAGKVRISGQLIDALSGIHLWADRFEGDLSDIFALQDEVTVNVVSAIQPRLLQAEVELAALRRPNDLNAYDLCLRARMQLYSLNRDAVAHAIRLCSRAQELDHRYGHAALLAAFSHMHNVTQGWAVDPKSELSEAVRLLRLALSVDGNDPEALAGLGRMTAYLTGDFDTATEMVDRAIVLNPNSWIAWEQRGETFNSTGDFREAIRSFERAIRLSPLDPFIFGTYAAMGLAFIGLGRFDDAIEAAKKALRREPLHRGALRCLASALANLGRELEAREAAARLLELVPNFCISEWTAGRRRSQVYVDGLRKAGLPE